MGGKKNLKLFYLSGILAACNLCCCGDYNRGIAIVKEVDDGVNAILVIVSFLKEPYGIDRIFSLGGCNEKDLRHLGNGHRGRKCPWRAFVLVYTNSAILAFYVI